MRHLVEITKVPIFEIFMTTFKPVIHVLSINIFPKILPHGARKNNPRGITRENFSFQILEELRELSCDGWPPPSMY